MTDKGNEPAFANLYPVGENGAMMPRGGLTKRELFAAMAMQGILAAQPGKFPSLNNEQGVGNQFSLAKACVQIANALLEALEEDKSK